MRLKNPWQNKTKKIPKAKTQKNNQPIAATTNQLRPLENFINESVRVVWQMQDLGSNLAPKNASQNRYVVFSFLSYSVLLSVL